MQSRIYLDYNSTTPVDPDVLIRAQPFLEADFGNPSSLYREGQKARSALNRARSEMAGLLRVHERELVFTSGATEALNHVIMGFFHRFVSDKGHIITTEAEHLAVLEPCRFLASRGWSVTTLPVDRQGRLSAASVLKHIRPETRLIALLHANNEIGTVQPINEIGQLAREAGVPLLVDAVQSLGKLPIDLEAWGASFAVFSGHKVGGFKGTGLLYVGGDQDITALIHGGHQEREQRAGTENVAGAVAFAEAARRAEERREKEASRLTGLRDRLEEGLKREVQGIRVSGHPTQRLCNTLHVAFEGLESEKLLMAYDLAGICVSNGSACNSGSVEPSHVVRAIGLDARFQKGTVRFSLGRGTTPQDIKRTLNETIRIVKDLQKERSAC